MATMLEQSRTQVVEIYTTLYESANLGEEQLNQLIEQADLMINLIKKTFIALIFLSSLFGILIQYIVAEKILKKLGYIIPPLPPFKTWKIPWIYSWFLFAGFLFILLGKDMPEGYFYLIGTNTLFLCAMICAITGMSVLCFFLNKFKLPGVFSSIILVLIFLFLGNIMMFLGFF